MNRRFGESFCRGFDSTGIFEKCWALVMTWSVRIAWWGLAVLFHALPGSVQADVDYHDSYETPRGLAMGLGARATSLGSSALAYHPAALAAAPSYELSAFSRYVPSAGRWGVGASVVDSTQQSFGMGASFRGITGGDDARYTGYDGRLGVGLSLGDVIVLGGAARYVNLVAQGDDFASLDDGDRVAKGFTVDASLGIQPFGGLKLALLGHNLVDRDSVLLPTLVGGSAGLSLGGSLSLGADLLVDMTTFEDSEVLVGGGLEFLTSGSVPLRAGYSFDAGRDLHTFTAGLGYLTPSVGIDLSLRQGISGGSETTLLAAFRYFVQ